MTETQPIGKNMNFWGKKVVKSVDVAWNIYTESITWLENVLLDG